MINLKLYHDFYTYLVTINVVSKSFPAITVHLSDRENSIINRTFYRIAGVIERVYIHKEK